MYNTGINRQASSILSVQVNNLKTNIKTIDDTCKMVELTEQSIKHLLDRKLDSFGSLLHESWLTKKKLSSNISNLSIDRIYDDALRAGAIGGKLLGAGGGGYMLFYVPEENHQTFLYKMNLYNRFEFKFVEYGSKIEMFS